MKQYAIEYGGEVKRFVENSRLDETSKSISYLKHQICSVQYFIKNKEKKEEIDIRKYLEFKKKSRKREE